MATIDPDPDPIQLDRRSFLKTSGTAAAGAALGPGLGWVAPEQEAFAASPDAAAADAGTGWAVHPFPLAQVRLGEGLFRDKRDLMLGYARNYGGSSDIFAGPDRLLSIFRAAAGLDTRGAEPVGGWESATGYLRGHYAGHFMSMLAQARAGTGEAIFREKLDYMVSALAECQAALARAAEESTPRVPGRFGTALRLTGTPLGQAECVRLPEGIASGLRDFSIAAWIKLGLYSPDDLPDRRRDPIDLVTGSVLFDFGSPNPAYAEPPLAHMYLTVRASRETPVPRFAITTGGREGEQALEGRDPLPVGEWVHLAVTRSGSLGTLYVNGEPVATNPGLTLSPADLGELTANWLGRRQFPQRNVSWLNADLDEFGIWSRALSTEEIRSLLQSPEGKAGGADVARYRFDEPSGPTAIDTSGRGRDAEIIAPTDGRRHPGFLSAYPETPFIRLEEFATYGGNQGIWAPYYTLHKIMAGLLDAHVHTGNEQALEILTGIGDWVWSRLEPLRQEQLDRMWNIYIAGEYGGINESLAALHALCPDRPRYLAAARRFVNTRVYAPTAAGEDVLDGRHANQHIPQFTGYLRIYEQGEGDEFRTAAANFWDMLVPHRTYSHGGVGVGEILRARDVIAGSLFAERNHAETCPLYNLLKLSRNLFFHDPDPKYMNFYERGLFNQIASSRRDAESDSSPEVTYFVPVRPGERRSYGNTGTCCGGTGMENHTKYQDSIYLRSADESALYVNLYIPSTLEWPERGFILTQITRYPAEGAATLIVNGRGPLDLRLRVPTWVRAGYELTINGEAQAIEAVPGTYLSLEREWRSGDRVEIRMPFTFRTERTIDDPTVQSLYYGPNLMAVQGPALGEDLASGLLEFGFYRHVKLDGDLAPALTPTDQPLHFTLNGRTLAPFFIADPVSSTSETTAPETPEGSRRSRRSPPTSPYHLYFRRREPAVVFGSADPGVANPVGSDGLTLLDTIWDSAPFESHARFLATVERILGTWTGRGDLTRAEGTAVLDAARRAEADLRP